MELPRVAPQHVIEEEAGRILKAHFNKKNGFVVRKLPEDYGVDYQIELIDDKGQVTGVSFCAQLKGSRRTVTKDGAVVLRLKKSTLNLFSRQLYPTIVIAIDISTEQGFWQNSFDILDDLDRRSPSWRSTDPRTAAIRIPTGQDFSTTQLSRLTNYVISVHKRKAAVPQGLLSLSQPIENGDVPPTIDDLRQIVLSHDYDKFFRVIASYGSIYTSDANSLVLYDIFQNIPPREFDTQPDGMAAFALAAFKLGYHQEARKWIHLALAKGMASERSAVHLEYILNQIDYIYGYKPLEDFLANLDTIERTASQDLKAAISLQKIRIEYQSQEGAARKYGRYRRMQVIEQTVKRLLELWAFCPDTVKEHVLLEIQMHYTVLVPFYWSEIIVIGRFREILNLDFPQAELSKMIDLAYQKTREGLSLYEQLGLSEKVGGISLSTQAESLMFHGLLFYNMLMLESAKLVFMSHLGLASKDTPPSENERQMILQSLTFFQRARKLFSRIGAKDRECIALINILGCYEDLKDNKKYDEVKFEIETIIKAAPVPDTLTFYRLVVSEGSLRRRTVSQLGNTGKARDIEKAEMEETDIEMQVECNSKALGITEGFRVENLRKDVIASVLAAKFRAKICKHMQLLQDTRHTLPLNTLYKVDPNRKAVCMLHGHESRVVHNDSRTVLDAFEKTYCWGCNSRMPDRRDAL